MEKGDALLRRLKKRSHNVALEIKITNKDIAKYVASFLLDNDIELSDEQLILLFTRVVQELGANIAENYGEELKAIIPFIAEKQGIQSHVPI